MPTEHLRIGQEIGRGALGRVHRISDSESGDVYAGKILHGSHQGDPRALTRFASEAAIVAEVQHPNIVRVFGLEEIEGQSVLRMELVDGPDLATLLAMEGPLALDRMLPIATALAAGLSAAHRAGLVHRDLKPHNILLTRDEVPKIADFGLARVTSFAGVDESAFAVVGTPDYMAPESIAPLAVDSRSDLYSLGCILFEMATGAPPFQGATAFSVLEAHRNASIPLIEQDLPEAFRALVASLLRKSPADRPQSAAAVLEALGTISAGGAIVPFRRTVLSVAGTCASCGATLVSNIAICFGCSTSQLTLEDGRHTLFIVGPGKVGEKLASSHRRALLDLLSANPALGIQPALLKKSVPRLPFVLSTKLSESSARALASRLESIGLRSEVQRGGAFGLRALRKKSWILSGRLLAIGVTGYIYLGQTLLSVIGPVVAVASAVAVGGGWYLAGRSFTKKAALLSEPLPEPVEKSLAALTPIVANMQIKRHRESLRATVERVIALCKLLPPAALLESERDLARLLDMSLIASARMDEIDQAIASADMRNPSPETLELLRERDRWAGRLLEVSAFLESLRMRMAALRHTGEESRTPHDLDELAAHIEALEEVQSL